MDVGTALATMQTDVIAKIGSPDGTGIIQSSVSTNAAAIATVNGKLAASWSVTLNANGYVSGIRSYNDGSTAGTIFIGDIFQVAFPGQNGGAPVPVFGIGSVNGAAKVVLRGDMFVDGSITGTMIQAGTIDAVHLKASSITAGKIAAGAINVGNLIADDVIVTGHLQVNSVAVVSVSSPADQIGVPDTTSAPRLIATLTVFVVAGGGNLLIQGGIQHQLDPGRGRLGKLPSYLTGRLPFPDVLHPDQLRLRAAEETPDPADGGLQQLHDHHGQPTNHSGPAGGCTRISSDRPVLDTLAIWTIRSQPQFPGTLTCMEARR